MLTPEDIELMRKTHEEIVDGRQHAITLIYETEGERDPITDENIGGGEDYLETVAVVTEISSQVKFDRYLDNGVVVEKGDIWFSVGIDEAAGIYEKIVRVQYDGHSYEVLSKDKKGIGERNRAEFVGRLIT